MHSYIKYLTQEDPIITDEGKQIEILHLDIQDDSEIFEDWAKQFRRNYCSDDELAEMTGCMNISAKEYLENFKLPSDSRIGRSTMSGDFGEILVSDYLQYVEEYVVPRTRYNRKVNKDTSTQGSDVLGYKKDSLNAVNDEVVVIEVKSSASNSSTVKAKNKLQEAIDHSNKDFKRFSTSIVASYLRLTDNPFNVIYGAAAVHSSQSYDIDIIKQAVSKNHKDYQKLRLLVIHSDELMEFIKELYSKASEV